MFRRAFSSSASCTLGVRRMIRGDGAGEFVTITYDRDDAHRQMTIRLSGAFDLVSALAMVASLAADDAWSYKILYDTQALMTAPTMIELQSLVDRVQVMAATKPRGPLAIVSPDPGVYTMAQVYATRLDGRVNISVFRTLDEGQLWLEGEG